MTVPLIQQAAVARPAKLRALEAARGLAATIAFATHLGEMDRLLSRTVAASGLFNWGTEAVLVFFALSGVVIRLSEERRPRSMRAFLTDRFLRLYPLYAIAVVAASIVALMAGEALSGRTIVGNLVFLETLQAYLVRVVPTDPPLWSLTFEVGFYLLFALCIRREWLLRAWTVAALLAAAAFYVMPSSGVVGHVRIVLAYSVVWLAGYWATRLRHRFALHGADAVPLVAVALVWSRTRFGQDYYDIFRLGGFGLLCIPALVRGTASDRRLADVHSVRRPWVAPLAGAVALSLLWARSDSRAVVKLALSTLCIVAVFAGPRLLTSNRFARVPRLVPDVLVYLGSISYALYVLHYPIVFAIGRWYGGPAVLGLILTLIVTIGISHAMERIAQPKIVSLLRPRTGSPIPRDRAAAVSDAA